MGSKIIQLDEITPRGEPTIQIVRPGYKFGDLRTKTASEALDYIKDVKPIPGKTVILVLAMSAGEFYGPNRNGDGWHERPLTVNGTELTEAQSLPSTYKTFETGAKVYQHHVNKDPAKSIGDVMRAFYNWQAHRVELLLSLDNKKAEKFVSQIEGGRFPPVSMGTKIPYDVCSICGNKAPTRASYCRHAREQLTDILPNGQRVFVWNPDSNFFDISIVGRPADQIAFTMKKVAEEIVISSAQLGEEYDDAVSKAADLRKLTSINKMIHGEIGATKDDDAKLTITPDFVRDIAMKAACDMPMLPDPLIQQVLAYKPAELFATLSKMGIILTTPEFVKYIIWKFAPTANIPDDMIQKAVAVQGLAFEFLAENPEVLQEIVETGMFDESLPNEKIETLFQPYMEKRSQFGEYLYRHVVPDVFKTPTRRGMLDTLSVTDPVTGRQYQTTRSASNAAKDWAVENKLTDLAGGGLLLGTAYKLFKHPKLRFLSPLAAVPGAMMGYRGAVGYPVTRAATGETIALPRERMPWESRFGLTGRGGTELVEKRSNLNDGSAAITLAQDFVQTNGVPKVATSLPADAGILTFEDASRWFGKLLI